MNHQHKLKIALTAGVVLLATGSCTEQFLEKEPIGAYSNSSLVGALGELRVVQGKLINTYATLDGLRDNNYGGGSNWLYGSVAADDAYKGSEPTDAANDINPIELYSVTPATPSLNQKWNACYDGIGQANEVINTLKTAKTIDPATAELITAEARFIRGHHHFEAKKVFNNVPYIDDNVTEYRVPNFEGAEYVNIWPQIEADLAWAADKLPEKQAQVGRVNKWAAKSLLAKAYMYQNKFAEAKPLLEEIIALGQTNKGVKYDLNEKFSDNFRISNENNKESIFAIQSSVGYGSRGYNGSYDLRLNYIQGTLPGGCCGFFTPTQNLVNSYKTENGLPLLDTFNQSDVTNDEKTSKDATFTPYAGTLDPRLDWTVGRRDIPYLDWGLNGGANWARQLSNGGPYHPKKQIYTKAEQDAKFYEAGGWGEATSALNIVLIRFADVLLWAAEVEVEIGSLDKARAYVNQVRRRAANPEGFVKKYAIKDDGSPDPSQNTEEPAANYVISEYPAGAPFDNKENARKAVRFERKLELAMEGQRFFDLVRWGIAAEVLNDYLAVESKKRTHLQQASFTKNRNEYYPIPQFAVTQSATAGGEPTLKQNPGY